MPTAESPRQRLPHPLNLERLVLLSGSLVLGLMTVAGMGTPRNWWTQNRELHFSTADASGLRLGMPVKIAGYPVGRVRQIQLLNDAQVLVTLSVGAEQERMIGRRSRATLTQDNLLEKSYIAISPDLDQPSGGSARDKTLDYVPSPSLATVIRELASSRIPLQKVIGNTAVLMDKRLPHSLDQLDRTLISGQHLAGSVERELVGRPGDLRQNLSRATDNLERTLSAVQTTLGEIQTLARSTNGLLQTLSRSWLLQLLQPATPPNAGPEPPGQLRNSRE